MDTTYFIVAFLYFSACGCCLYLFWGGFKRMDDDNED